MPTITISAEDLLAGANARYDLEIPPTVLRPGLDLEAQIPPLADAVVVQLKPINLGAFQLITKAAKDDPGLVPILMIKEACVQPELSTAQIKAMHLGLIEFLIEHIRMISGLSEKKNSRMV